MTADVRRRRTSALIGGLGCALLFGLIALAVDRDPHWLGTVDHDLGLGPERFTADQSWVLDPATFVARVTHPDVLVALVVALAAALAVRGYWRAGVWSLIVIEASRWSYVLLKATFERHRPTWEDPAAHAGGWSFPSGHATVIGGAAGIAIVLAVMFSASRQVRTRVVTGALAVATIVGLDRVLLGVHYPSDVVAGLLLGGTLTLLALAAFDPLPRGAGRHRTTIAP